MPIRITRDQVDSSLWELVRRAQGVVYRARDIVWSSPVCAGYQIDSILDVYNPNNWFGDEAACSTLLGNLSRLNARVQELSGKVGTITSKADRDITQGDVDDVQGYADLIIAEAETIAGASEMTGFRGFVAATVRDFAAFVVTVARETVEFAGEVGGAAVGGLLDGLGPIGSLLLVGGLYLFFTRARA